MTTPLTTISSHTLAVEDDRDVMIAHETAFLIVEDNEPFAQLLKENVREQNEKALIAHSAKEAFELLEKYKVKGILLDLGLPDMNGTELLKTLKIDPRFRKIPVYVISGSEQEKLSKESGAIGYAPKPIAKDTVAFIMQKIQAFNDKSPKQALLVEDDLNLSDSLTQFLGSEELNIVAVNCEQAAREELQKGIYDLAIIDLGLQEGDGFKLCEYIKTQKLEIPVIVNTGKELSKDEEKRLKQYSDAIVIKTALSQNRLLREVDMFMHRVNHAPSLATEQDSTRVDLSGKKILVADDDIRNIYVLSEILGGKNAEVLTAGNGQEAIELLEKTPDIDLVLMDIMMPVMNGYQATQAIKQNSALQAIPVIAVTAKAMPEDRVKALEAGCDDYLTKPINKNLLLKMIEGWLANS